MEIQEKESLVMVQEDFDRFEEVVELLEEFTDRCWISVDSSGEEIVAELRPQSGDQSIGDIKKDLEEKC
ncbi:MAG: hypothetical protein MUP63_04200 [Candidatus Nanohaloarchaeota archaeon QJJ-7]|nr:hypothetical protein [Candidatus Nanohaloarchaeota archaeon QJJ-7]